MGILDNILREVGLGGTRRTRRKSGFLSLPSPQELKEKAERIVGDLSELKDIPKALMDRLTEADEDFRDADRSLRGTRLRGKRKSRT